MKEALFYQAPNARTGDVIPKFIDGKYQIFYLKNWKNCGNLRTGCPLIMSITRPD